MICHPIVYAMFVNCLYITLCVASVIYLVLYGTKSALLAFVVIMSSSHNITTSLCCYGVNHFILVVTILKYDRKFIINTIIRKIFVVSIYKP
jgi:hypothetical protein